MGTTTRRCTARLLLAIVAVAISAAACVPAAPTPSTETPLGALCETTQWIASGLDQARQSAEAARSGDQGKANELARAAMDTLSEARASIDYASHLVSQGVSAGGTVPPEWGPAERAIQDALDAANAAIGGPAPVDNAASGGGAPSSMDVARASLAAVPLPDTCKLLRTAP